MREDSQDFLVKQPPVQGSIEPRADAKHPEQEDVLNLSSKRAKYEVKKQTSQKKIDANRRNALQSTGPRTTLGRKAVSRNAIRHGLLARGVVILDGDGAESLMEFRRLHDQVEDFYKPVNFMESYQVETIVCCIWRLARVQHAETGEIQKTQDTLSFDRVMAQTYAFSDELLKLHRGRGRPNLEQSPLGIRLLRAILTEIKRTLVEGREISEGSITSFFAAFVNFDAGLVTFCFPILERLKNSKQAARPNNVETDSNENAGKSTPDEALQEDIAIALILIDAQLELLKVREKGVINKNELAETAERRSLCVPPAEVMDKLLRYEIHLDRKLQRAMDILDRMQRRRGGEPQSPSLNVTLLRG